MPSQEIRIPIVRRHFTLSNTGETEINNMAGGYKRQWFYAEAEEYFEALLDDGTWRVACQHALLRPGAVKDEAVIVGANGCVGIDVEPNQNWAANYYAIEFAAGAAPFNSAITGANGQILITENLIYDITDARWEYRAAQAASLVQVGAGVNMYAFAAGAVAGLADVTAATTNAMVMSNVLTTFNPNSGIFNFTVNSTNGVSLFSQGNLARGARIGINTITPMLNIGSAAGDYTADDSGLHINAPAGFGGRLIIDGGISTIDISSKSAGANDKIAQLRNNADGFLEFRSLNDNLTERRADILNLEMELGNVGIGTATFQAACESNLAIAEGVAPGGATADQGYIWAQDDGGTAELYVQDGAGNQLKISPHSDKGEWEFQCKNITTGRVLNIQMEQLVKFLDKQFGTNFLTESEPL